MKPYLRVFAVGDVMGRPGRRCLGLLLPKIKTTYAPDLMIVNGENIAGGFGITARIYEDVTRSWGFDVVTTGNHWHDKPEIHSFGATNPQLLLPANMYNVSDYKRGYYVGTTGSRVPGVAATEPAYSYAVINLTGCLFMKGDNRCPFEAVDRILAELPATVKVRIIDVHAEATSEKQALAHYVSGRASLVYGTHTHCPTADERILAGTTGFQSDVGMTGGYDSVIGMRSQDSLAFFLNKTKAKFEPAKTDPWLCGLIADIDPDTGHCLRIERLKWRLADMLPDSAEDAP